MCEKYRAIPDVAFGRALMVRAGPARHTARIRMKSPFRILLVDDHAFVRRAIRRLLEVQPDLRVCGEAESGARALQLVQSQRPDVVVLDLVLEQEDGLLLTKELRRRYPDLPILILSLHKESLFAERALHAGADGFLMKNDAPERLVEAVRAVLDRRIYVSPTLKQEIFGRLRGLEKNPRWDAGAHRATRRSVARVSFPARRKTARKPAR